MARTTVLFYFVVTLAVLLEPATDACVCICDDSDLETWINDAKMIFIGEVRGKRSAEKDSLVSAVGKEAAATLSETINRNGGSVSPDDRVWVSSCGSEWIDVSMIETLKGSVPRTAAFLHTSIGTACDFSFPIRRGRRYLFFGGQSDDGTLFLSGCSPARPAKRAKDLISTINTVLGPPHN